MVLEDVTNPPIELQTDLDVVDEQQVKDSNRVPCSSEKGSNPYFIVGCQARGNWLTTIANKAVEKWRHMVKNDHLSPISQGKLIEWKPGGGINNYEL